MKERYKVSGKRAELPEPAVGWTLTPRSGGWVLAEGPDGQRQRIWVTEARGKLSASLGGTLWHGEMARDQRSGASGSAGGGDSDLVAQFPGKVRKILVQPGAKVAEGDALVLVEAMKMEFAIKAPFAGRVTRVLVQEAQQLSPGDRFVEMEQEDAR